MLRRLAMARVLAEHGSPRLTWEVLRNLDWSKLTSGVFAECEEYTTIIFVVEEWVHLCVRVDRVRPFSVNPDRNSY